MGRKKTEAPYEILHVNERIVAVNKSAGLPVVPTRRGGAASLRDLLAEALGERPFVVHRIDRDTSGVVLFARDAETHRALSMLFERREVRKTYLGIVRGTPVPREGLIDLPLAHDRRDVTRMHVARRGGKSSQTAYRTLEAFEGFALVALHPLTGRTHQLRVHLSAIGHPLVVDPVYGGAAALCLSEFKRGYRRKKSREERPLISRLSLHALSLELMCPSVSDERVRIEASPPRDFSVCLKQLAKHASTFSSDR